uniref:Uncharacterized protein n=1 Tax=Rhipicephalus microplus TaxID=6941 RepID=A0A6G5A1M4_RHIMP
MCSFCHCLLHTTLSHLAATHSRRHVPTKVSQTCAYLITSSIHRRCGPFLSSSIVKWLCARIFFLFVLRGNRSGALGMTSNKINCSVSTLEWREREREKNKLRERLGGQPGL